MRSSQNHLTPPSYSPTNITHNNNFGHFLYHQSTLQLSSFQHKRSHHSHHASKSRNQEGKQACWRPSSRYLPWYVHDDILHARFVAAMWHSFYRVRQSLTRLYSRHDQGSHCQREFTIPGAFRLVVLVMIRLRHTIRLMAPRLLQTTVLLETLANASSHTAQGENRFIVSRNHTSSSLSLPSLEVAQCDRHSSTC